MGTCPRSGLTEILPEPCERKRRPKSSSTICDLEGIPTRGEPRGLRGDHKCGALWRAWDGALGHHLGAWPRAIAKTLGFTRPSGFTGPTRSRSNARPSRESPAWNGLPQSENEPWNAGMTRLAGQDSCRFNRSQREARPPLLIPVFPHLSPSDGPSRVDNPRKPEA